MRTQLVLLSVVLAFAVFAVANDDVARAAPSTNRDYITYVVLPHPDDETFIWSSVQNNTNMYPVFIVLTEGEQSAFCDLHGLDKSQGEEDPRDYWGDNGPWQRWSDNCETARKNSFRTFLQGIEQFDSTLEDPDDDGSHQGVDTSPFGDVCRIDKDGDDGSQTCNAADDPDLEPGDIESDHTYDLRASGKNAVMFFNVGDGDVKNHEVRWAIATARDIKGSFIPDLEEKHILTVFDNTNDIPNCNKYKHRDHRAAHETLWNTNYGNTIERIGATCPEDEDESREVRINPRSYWEKMIDVDFDNNNQRKGVVQRWYGWLAGDSDYYKNDAGLTDDGFWPYEKFQQNVETHHTGPVFTRVQHFWVRVGNSTLQ